MLIGNFLKNIKKEFKNHQFAGLSFNSEDCKKNYIFFAIQGTKSDGTKFIDMQLKRVQQLLFQSKNLKVLKIKCYF